MLPLKKKRQGGALAKLKGGGGHKRFWGSLVLEVLAMLKVGVKRGTHEVLPCLKWGGGAKGVRPPNLYLNVGFPLGDKHESMREKGYFR